jgi:hypothetical protein
MCFPAACLALETRKNVGHDIGRRSLNERKSVRNLHDKRLFWTAAALRMYARRRLGQSQYYEQPIAAGCLVNR